MHRITQRPQSVGQFTAQNEDGTFASVRRLFLQASSYLSCLSQVSPNYTDAAISFACRTTIPGSSSSRKLSTDTDSTLVHSYPPSPPAPSIVLRPPSPTSIHAKLEEIASPQTTSIPRIGHHPKSHSLSLHHIPPHISLSRRRRHSLHVHFPPSKTLNHRTRPRSHCALCLPRLSHRSLLTIVHRPQRLPLLLLIISSVYFHAQYLSSRFTIAHRY